MIVHAKGDAGATLGSNWVGRSLRRVEDPALVIGQGRFTGDLPAALWVRFVRSSVASGRAKNRKGRKVVPSPGDTCMAVAPRRYVPCL